MIYDMRIKIISNVRNHILVDVRLPSGKFRENNASVLSSLFLQSAGHSKYCCIKVHQSALIFMGYIDSFLVAL